MDMNMKEYVNWKMSHDVKFGETEGYPLVLEDCRKNKDLKNFQIYGNSVQGKGENLFNEETVTSGVYIDDTGVEIESTLTGLRLSDYIEVKPFINYFLIVANTGTSAVNARISFYDTEQNFVSQTAYSISGGVSSTKSIQIAEDIYYVRISFVSSVEFYEDLNPENPIEIQSVGELTTKNLLNYDLNSIGSSPNASSLKSFVVSNLIKFDSGTYTLSYNISNATTYRLHWVVFSDNGQTELITEARTYAKVTLKANSDTGYYNTNLGFFMLNGNTRVSYNDVEITVSQPCYIGFYVSGGDMSIESVVTEQQLELGEVKTEYEPYHKYKIPVVARGKNLLDVKNVYPDFANDENGITISNSDFNSKLTVRMPVEWKESTQYTFSANYEITNADSNGFFVRVQYTDDTTISLWNSMGGSGVTGDKNGTCTVITEKGKTVKAMFFSYTTSSRKYNAKITDMQLEEGITGTPYEPYVEPQTFNIYLDEPLRGMYSRRWNRTERDYIDFKRSVVVRKFLKEVYNGSEKWVAFPSKENTFGKQYLKKVSQYGICSHYGDSQTTGVDGRIYLYVTSQAYITDSRFNTVEEFKAFLAEQASLGTPVTVVYCTYDAYNGSPIEKPIELPELPKTQAKTMIYEVIDTSIQPSDMYGKYIKKY